MLSLTRPLDIPTPTTTPESWSDYDYYVVGLSLWILRMPPPTTPGFTLHPQYLDVMAQKHPTKSRDEIMHVLTLRPARVAAAYELAKQTCMAKGADALGGVGEKIIASAKEHGVIP